MKLKHLLKLKKQQMFPRKIKNLFKDAKWDTENDESWEVFRERLKRVSADQHDLVETSMKCGKRIVWVGDHDCREGIITKIKLLYENGKFLNKWIECPFPWITHYGQHKNKSSFGDFSEYFQTTRIRLDRLPENVRKCINNTYRRDQA